MKYIFFAIPYICKYTHTHRKKLDKNDGPLNKSDIVINYGRGKTGLAFYPVKNCITKLLLYEEIINNYNNYIAKNCRGGGIYKLSTSYLLKILYMCVCVCVYWDFLMFLVFSSFLKIYNVP